MSCQKCGDSGYMDDRPCDACDAGSLVSNPPISARLARLAVAAAAAGTTASAELLRYSREGDATVSFALEPDTIEQLADALKMAIEIELPAIERQGDREGAEMLGQLAGACVRFIEGWA